MQVRWYLRPEAKGLVTRSGSDHTYRYRNTPVEEDLRGEFLRFDALDLYIPDDLRPYVRMVSCRDHLPGNPGRHTGIYSADPNIDASNCLGQLVAHGNQYQLTIQGSDVQGVEKMWQEILCGVAKPHIAFDADCGVPPLNGPSKEMSDLVEIMQQIFLALSEDKNAPAEPTT